MPIFNRKKIKILVVDDSIINQEIACDFMADLGFSIDTADNGLQALESVKLNSYSMICMDIRMPVMDGLEATKAIREYELSHKLNPVIIIATTSETSSGIKRRCFDAGMNDYLLKPYSQQEILQKITQWLNNEPLSGDESSLVTSHTSAHKNVSPLLDAVEDIAQISHWFWHLSDQQIQFSKHLQHHFCFPLSNIETLDNFIAKVGGDEMNALVRQSISGNHETRWEQKIKEPDTEESKYILHKFRVVICEDTNPILIGTVQDITFIRKTEQQIIELASYDAVTGLSSRFRFNQQLEDLIKYAHRHSQQFALLYIKPGVSNEIDDNFKHEADDKILVEFTNRLRTKLRKSDFACRLVDDDFCLAIKDITDGVMAMKIAERYVKLFENPIELAGRNVAPHINIGLAMYPHNGAKATTLIKAANIAMKKAQSMDGNHCAFYENKVTDAVQLLINKENELRIALEEGQFELHYQPRIKLSSGKILCAKSSIRWNHPDQSIRLPECFLTDAEELNLMTDIGRWTIQQACNQIKAWKDNGLDDIYIAVNISQQYFEKSDFVDSVSSIVNDAGISPSLIELEITESISRDQITFTETCQRLRAFGFKTAIDDFGTGYSCLSSLKQIHIDALMIDHEFIRNLPNDNQSSMVIGTILGLSNALGLQVIAKGVENNDQLQTLAGMGCHMAQGPYFSHPVPGTEMPELSKHNYRNINIYRVA